MVSKCNFEASSNASEIDAARCSFGEELCVRGAAGIDSVEGLMFSPCSENEIGAVWFPQRRRFFVSQDHTADKNLS